MEKADLAGDHGDHPARHLLIASVDDELTAEQAVTLERHLAACEECRANVRMWRGLSSDVEQAVRSVRVEPASGRLSALDAKLREAEIRRSSPSRANDFRRLGWVAALAASIAVVLFVAPHMRERSVHVIKPVASAPQSGTLEVDGETFISLPYSNPDLPNAPHIVQMEVSVASLADAGIVFEPIARQAVGGRDSVLADVLFGVDGQPLGVHVLDSE